MVIVTNRRNREILRQRRLRSFKVIFSSGDFMEFGAICQVGATEYAQYRAAIRGEGISIIYELNT